MTHVHEHREGIVVSDGEGPATALIAVIALAIIGALIWFLAFSGIVFNRSSDNSPNINIQNPPAEQNNNNTNTNPSPAQS